MEKLNNSEYKLLQNCYKTVIFLEKGFKFFAVLIQFDFKQLICYNYAYPIYLGSILLKVIR